jgi:hypothetical protein
MKNILNIPAGASVFLGAPAHPMPDNSIKLLKDIVSQEEAIVEAHIPLCYIPSVMEIPSQTLFVMFQTPEDVAKTVMSLCENVYNTFPSGESIEIIPLSITDRLVPNIRAASCKLFQRNTSKAAPH